MHAQKSNAESVKNIRQMELEGGLKSMKNEEKTRPENEEEM